MTTDLKTNIESVRERIHAACTRVNRSPDDVAIVAVTKTRGADVINAAIDAGLKDIGENRIQEFLDKREGVTRPCTWHYIGKLQRNKVTKAIAQFSLIHSVDTTKLAEMLNRVGGERELVTPILIEVNTSREITKHGFEPEEVLRAADAIEALPWLKLEGMMTIGPLTEERAAIRRAFQSLFRLRAKLDSSIGRTLTHLSMGMSDDFETAIEEGATIIRLGRVLFGKRGA